MSNGWHYAAYKTKCKITDDIEYGVAEVFPELGWTENTTFVASSPQELVEWLHAAAADIAIYGVINKDKEEERDGMYVLKEPLLIDCTGYIGVVPAGFQASSSDNYTIAVEFFKSQIEKNTPGYTPERLLRLQQFYTG